MDYGWLNVGSLVLGIAALILPVLIMVKRVKGTKAGAGIWMSMAFCLLAVIFQLAYGNHLVEIEDWSALMDTSQATLSLSAKLALFTALLDMAAFLTAKDGGQKK